jgi:hypothetical protein
MKKGLRMVLVDVGDLDAEAIADLAAAVQCIRWQGHDAGFVVVAIHLLRARFNTLVGRRVEAMYEILIAWEAFERTERGEK